jgi:hypothetical protein
VNFKASRLIGFLAFGFLAIGFASDAGANAPGNIALSAGFALGAIYNVMHPIPFGLMFSRSAPEETPHVLGPRLVRGAIGAVQVVLVLIGSLLVFGPKLT